MITKWVYVLMPVKIRVKLEREGHGYGDAELVSVESPTHEYATKFMKTIGIDEDLEDAEKSLTDHFTVGGLK